jgi:hypothetical protein
MMPCNSTNKNISQQTTTMFLHHIILFLSTAITIFASLTPSQTHFNYILDLILDYATAEPQRENSIYINSNILRIATSGDRFKQVSERVKREHGKTLVLIDCALEFNDVPFKMKYLPSSPNKIFIFYDDESELEQELWKSCSGNDKGQLVTKNDKRSSPSLVEKKYEFNFQF